MAFKNAFLPPVKTGDFIILIKSWKRGRPPAEQEEEIVDTLNVNAGPLYERQPCVFLFFADLYIADEHINIIRIGSGVCPEQGIDLCTCR